MNAVLVVAGHDSSGRAGVDADAEAIERCGLRAVRVVTAWTRQQGTRVLAVEPRDPADWRGEAEAALARVDALKVGLLPGAEHVHALAALLDAALGAGLPVVVDPVLRATGGEEFLGPEGVAALCAEVLARPVVLTPNLSEALLLAGDEARDAGALARDPEARVEVARALLRRGLAAVLLKGGHGAEDPVRDLVLRAGAPPTWCEHPRVSGAGLRGSGCRHASVVAASLAAGASLEEAAARAGRYLFERLRA